MHGTSRPTSGKGLRALLYSSGNTANIIAASPRKGNHSSAFDWDKKFTTNLFNVLIENPCEATSSSVVFFWKSGKL
jgi:hypothetical protein